MAVATLSNKNPYYVQREADWMMMRDAYEGEKAIKLRGELYLPPTTSQVMEGLTFGAPGWTAYQAYMTRAVYHELVKPSLMAMLGVMHRKGPEIELPAKLESFRKHITRSGEDVNWLMQKITEQTMLMGRYGMLLDVEDKAPANALPYVVTYDAENIINWDQTKVVDKKPRKTNLIVLNESGYERRTGLSWSQVNRFRVLAMGEIANEVWDTNFDSKTYVAAGVEGQSVPENGFDQPSLAGRGLEDIPFVFVGPRDLVAEPDMPVLMPLARMGLAIYRTEADYRQALFMQGQKTLVVIGQQTDINQNRSQLGAFGSIDLPVNGDAKYIGADSGGNSDLRIAIQDDLKRAAQLGAQLLSERGNEAEAGEALKIRVASRTATLTTVAHTSAKGLEEILKHAAKWVGADPDKVVVKPNMDFADDPAQAQDLVYLQTAKNMGLPLSEKSVHGWLKKREFTTLEYEEEKRLKDQEEPSIVPPSGGVRGVDGPASTASGNLPTKANTLSKQEVKAAGGQMETDD